MIYALYDLWHIILRDLRTRIRMPIFIFISLFQPILWLVLFSQMFEAVDFGTQEYRDYFAPGVVVMTVLFSSAFSGFSTLMDIDAGVISKMMATPVNRVSIITGRVIANVFVGVLQASIILFVAVVFMGVPVETGIPGMIFMLFFAVLLGMGLAAFSNGLAVLLRRQETVMAAVNLFTMPLMFLSSMMMKPELLPDWLDTVRLYNPVDYAIVAVHTLAGEGYVWDELWKSLVVLVCWAIAGVTFGTLMFHRRAEH
ncbi:ABC transporter permease [Chloroflexota bacterium]